MKTPEAQVPNTNIITIESGIDYFWDIEIHNPYPHNKDIRICQSKDIIYVHANMIPELIEKLKTYL